MKAQFLHTELLESLKQRLEERMQQHRFRMAKGLPELEYREYVGRHKEAAELIEAIAEVAKQDEEDDEQPQKREGARR